VPLAVDMGLGGVIIAIVTFLAIVPRRLLFGWVLPLPAVVTPLPEDALTVCVTGGVIAGLSTIAKMYERHCVVIARADDAIPANAGFNTSGGSTDNREEVRVSEGWIPEGLAVTVAVTDGSLERIRESLRYILKIDMKGDSGVGCSLLFHGGLPNYPITPVDLQSHVVSVRWCLQQVYARCVYVLSFAHFILCALSLIF
jgi:hypothetical protein